MGRGGSTGNLIDNKYLVGQVGALFHIDNNSKANGIFCISYIGRKRYLYAQIVPGGTHGTGTIIGVNVALSNAEQRPIPVV